MKQRSYFVVIRVMQEEGVCLEWGRDIFERPMPWGVWLQAILFKKSAWRFLRVFGLDVPFTQYAPYWEEGDVFFGTRFFRPEPVTLLLVCEWVLQSLYYGTSLRFWQWPLFRQFKD